MVINIRNIRITIIEYLWKRKKVSKQFSQQSTDRDSLFRFASQSTIRK